MPNQSNNTRFGLVRHAQTIWNREKKIQGQKDSPLTPGGKIQASRWGQLLKPLPWNRILTSDIGRAMETAGIINQALKIALKTDARLREQDWGQWTGETIFRIQTDTPRELDNQVRSGWDFCPPDGEVRRNVLERSRQALSEAAAKWPGETILVVTHEGVVKSLIYHLCGRKYLPGEPAIIKPYQLHWLAHDADGLKIEEINALALEKK
ncbi:MAG: histidine phosphatase family protein [Deltaproteobacteria bacterium]|jgi:probable phosphoglycerate mutase|nr:histidine phosphatase family protein [Deltaproteobacteria bacterium]MBW2483546.1 histidine phosphatase family protein [Deltaproteobacteria bacterium]